MVLDFHQCQHWLTVIDQYAWPMNHFSITDRKQASMLAKSPTVLYSSYLYEEGHWHGTEIWWTWERVCMQTWQHSQFQACDGAHTRHDYEALFWKLSGRHVLLSMWVFCVQRPYWKVSVTTCNSYHIWKKDSMLFPNYDVMLYRLCTLMKLPWNPFESGDGWDHHCMSGIYNLGLPVITGSHGNAHSDCWNQIGDLSLAVHWQERLDYEWQCCFWI